MMAAMLINFTGVVIYFIYIEFHLLNLEDKGVLELLLSLYLIANFFPIAFVLNQVIINIEMSSTQCINLLKQYQVYLQAAIDGNHEDSQKYLLFKNQLDACI
jgi:hypothetical protein